MKANVVQVEHDTNNNIMFLEDLSNTTGSISITNDAENVVRWFRANYGNTVRIVYKDTDNEWWEIVWQADGMWDSDFSVRFKPWNGLAWDKLSKV